MPDAVSNRRAPTWTSSGGRPYRLAPSIVVSIAVLLGVIVACGGGCPRGTDEVGNFCKSQQSVTTADDNSVAAVGSAGMTSLQGTLGAAASMSGTAGVGNGNVSGSAAANIAGATSSPPAQK